MPEIYENRVSKFHGKGENNPNVKVTEEDVKEIRKRKLNGEQRKNVYADYADKLTLSGFQKIWYYKTWKDIK